MQYMRRFFGRWGVGRRRRKGGISLGWFLVVGRFVCVLRVSLESRSGGGGGLPQPPVSPRRILTPMAHTVCWQVLSRPVFVSSSALLYFVFLMFYLRKLTSVGRTSRIILSYFILSYTILSYTWYAVLIILSYLNPILSYLIPGIYFLYYLIWSHPVFSYLMPGIQFLYYLI